MPRSVVLPLRSLSYDESAPVGRSIEVRMCGWASTGGWVPLPGIRVPYP